MAEIRPFRGIRYNVEKVGDLARVICPPYDVISPEHQKELYRRSEFNAIRLEYGAVNPGDTPENNRDTRAAAALRDWLARKVLQPDGSPSLYINDHYFRGDGMLMRRGLMARVRLEPPDRRTVLPHENTVAGIRSDRLQLLRACRTNFSPIFILYNDPEQAVTNVLAAATRGKPVLDFVSTEGERHLFWAVTDPAMIAAISSGIGSQLLYIADGHHRYETSQAYKEQRQKETGKTTGEEPWNFMLMTLVAFTDPGLIVFPIHRMVRGLSPASLEQMRDALSQWFVTVSIAWGGERPIETVLKEKNGLFAVLGLEPGKALVSAFRPDVNIDQFMPAGRSLAYRRLPVSLLHHAVLDRLPDLTGGEVNITYTHDEREARRELLKGGSQVAVLLPQTPVSTIKAIADAGDRMPGKSTYFHPKLPTGLVMNPVEE